MTKPTTNPLSEEMIELLKPILSKQYRNRYADESVASDDMIYTENAREIVAALDPAFTMRSGPCDLGVGCDEFGVCYASAHNQPEKCGRSFTMRSGDEVERGAKAMRLALEQGWDDETAFEAGLNWMQAALPTPTKEIWAVCQNCRAEFAVGLTPVKGDA